MRELAVALALAMCAAVPGPAAAEVSTRDQPAASHARTAAGSELSAVLKKLGVTLIPAAAAAECIEEGDNCTADEQCCSGLKCTGEPPATCTLEE